MFVFQSSRNKDKTNFKNERVLVWGLIRSGESAACLLNNLGAIVTVNDALPMEENSNIVSKRY
jgi:UDP-N-acetylmuramoylalanine--D-glutamate ligase